MPHQFDSAAYNEALRLYFRGFTPTVELVQELLTRRAHAQEVVLLTCARLDALASGSVREGRSRRQAFVDFVVRYGHSKRLLERISAGDLYYEVGYHAWLAEGMIPIPGRVKKFSDINEPALELLLQSGVPLTSSDARRLFLRIARGLKSRFRVSPGQRKHELEAVGPQAIREAVGEHPAGRNKAPWLKKGLQPLLDRCTLGALLYTKYRCGAIHGGQAVLNEEKFFTLTEPYWEPFASDYYGGFLSVEFPGAYLLKLLRATLQTYEEHLRARRRMPPDVHHAAVGQDWLAHLDWLDQELLPESRELTPRLRG